MIKEKLGEEWNPLFIEKVLEKNIAELLEFIFQNLEDIKPMVGEVIRVAYSVQNDQKPPELLAFGIKMIDGQFKLLSFVAQEIKSRLESIEIKATNT